MSKLQLFSFSWPSLWVCFPWQFAIWFSSPLVVSHPDNISEVEAALILFVHCTSLLEYTHEYISKKKKTLNILIIYKNALDNSPQLKTILESSRLFRTLQDLHESIKICMSIQSHVHPTYWTIMMLKQLHEASDPTILHLKP